MPVCPQPLLFCCAEVLGSVGFVVVVFGADFVCCCFRSPLFFVVLKNDTSFLLFFVADSVFARIVCGVRWGVEIGRFSPFTLLET